MFVWWFIGLIAFSCTGISYCDDDNDNSTAVDGELEEVHINLSIGDNQPETIAKTEHHSPNHKEPDTESNSITTLAPELLSCYECTNCRSKADNIIRVCDEGINMCYKRHQHINKNSQLIHRGCSTSKGICTAPIDGPSNSYDTITCCERHQCNHAAQVKLSLSFSSLSLFTILIIFIYA